MKKVDFHSFVSVPLELWFDENFLSSATGFFYRYENNLCLISNWHVFSGRNATTGQPMHSRGAIPNRLGVRLNGEQLGSYEGTIFVNLEHGLSEDETGANWFQHPLGQDIDIAFMKVSEIPPKTSVYFPTDFNSDTPLSKRVGSECFVVGYPIKPQHNDLTPIWKRATVASEYYLQYRDQDCFLIDTTTSVGMSGSPVYFRQSGMVVCEDGSVVAGGELSTEFAGIYSGRFLTANEGSLSLGFVWKKSLIVEMIQSSLQGSYAIR